MDLSSWILLGLTLSVCVLVFAQDRALFLRGLAGGARLFQGVWLELLLGFLLAGLLEVLLPASRVAAWLGHERLTRGILVGWGAGLIIPGGPYVLFPLVASLLKNGAAPGAIIALLTAKTLISPLRMLTYEGPLLGWEFTLARLIPALFVPPILGLIGHLLCRPR